MDPTIPKVESQPIIHVGWCDSSFEQNQSDQKMPDKKCYSMSSIEIKYVVNLDVFFYQVLRSFMRFEFGFVFNHV